MDDITLNLLVIAVFVIIGGLIFFLVRSKQSENEQNIIQFATEHGWKYESLREPLAWGTRLSSPQWTIEALSRSSGKESGPGSSDVSISTTWQANAPGSILLIGVRTAAPNLGGFGAALSQQVLQLALGADASGLTEIQTGSDAFRKTYMLWAHPSTEVTPTSALESALLNWKGVKPLIKRTSKGLTIELRGVRYQKYDEFNALVQLGEALLAAYQR